MASSTPTKNKRVTFSLPIKAEESPLTESELRRMLPASFRNGPAWIGTPHNRVQHFLKDDLNIERLAEVSPYFFILGKAKPPQALHHQQALGLEIFITEKMDTHLLWTKGKIFIKPFPRYLIKPQFWLEHLVCPKACSYAPEFQLLRAAGLVRRPTQLSKRKPCEHSKLWKCAMGFVYSYIALIAHESDFHIAKSCRLLPDDLDFDEWKEFVDRILRSGKIYGQIDERFTYGELSMARLNNLLMFQQPLRYLFQGDGSYGFLRDHSSSLPSVSLYVGVVLASAKAKPAIAKLKGSRALQLALVMMLGCLWVLYSILSIGGKGLPTTAVEE
ncbi:hypothetical protein GGI35DRAFT_29854 [Trichoderma velutinum]